MAKKKKTNHYSYWQALWLSFYSPSIYIDAAKRWSGIGGMYLLLVAFILSAPIAFQFIQHTRHFFSESLEPAIKEMPTLIIKDDKIKFKEDKSKGITEKTEVWIWPPAPSAEHPIPEVVINLPRTIESFNSVFIPVLITQDYLQIQNYSPWGQKIISDKFKIDKSNAEILGATELGKILNQIKMNLVNTAYFYLTSFIWALSLPCLFFFSTLANLLYLALRRSKLPWLQAARVLAIAVTPGLLFLEVLYFAHALTQLWILFTFAIVIGYYFFGARACLMDRELVPRWR